MKRDSYRDATLAILAVIGSGPVGADVVFTGTVTPGSPGEVGPNSEIIVGPASQLSNSVDPRGAIRVDEGSDLIARRLLVGSSSTALAQTVISGAGTRVSVVGGGNEFNPTLAVARDGSGYLRVDDGAWLDVSSNDPGSGVLSIGSFLPTLTQGPATVEVSGDSTLVTIGSRLIVNEGPASRLSITDGGVVRIGAFNFPGLADIRGTVEVTGPRSELQANQLTLGEIEFGQPAASGVLYVGDGATVRQFANSFTSVTVGEAGRIVLNGGTFGLEIPRLRGALEGSGVVTRDVGIEAEGRLLVGAGKTLDLRGAVTSVGTIRVDGGTLNAYREVIIRDQGEVAGITEFRSSEVTFLAGLTQDGRMTAVRSRIDTQSRLVNSGKMVLTDSELVLGSTGGLLNSPSGRRIDQGLVLENSTIKLAETIRIGGGGISNAGLVEARAGDNRIDVSVQDVGGSLVVRTGASIELANASFGRGATIEPGGVARFDNDAVIGGTLAIGLNSDNLDRPSLVAASPFPERFQADLAVTGRLEIDAAALTAVAIDDTFLLVQADRLEADFSEIALPDLPGTLEFLPQLTDTTLSLVVIDSAEQLPGDFNADGIVNAADYTVWRDGLPGGSTNLDRLVWQTNFGRSFSTIGAAVPEPTTAVAVALAVLAATGFRRAA